jgi:hypothetical protein
MKGYRNRTGSRIATARIIRQDPADLKATPVLVFSVNSPGYHFLP